MGKIGYGYGSEWHLLRQLGYHRAYFSEKVNNLIGCQRVDWLDFKFSPKCRPLQDDKELMGLEFIQDTQVQKSGNLFGHKLATHRTGMQ